MKDKLHKSILHLYERIFKSTQMECVIFAVKKNVKHTISHLGSILLLFEIQLFATEDMNAKIIQDSHNILQQSDILVSPINSNLFFQQSRLGVTHVIIPSSLAKNKLDLDKQTTILKTLFKVTLEKIHVAIDISPSCFICYAWGNREHEKRVRLIAQDLKEAGIDVLIDIWALKSGDDVLEYAGKIRSCDYILLMGAPELIEKFEQKTDNHISIELDSISVRYKHDRKAIIPCLIAGDGNKVFPYTIGGGENLVYSDFRQEESYYRHFLTLLQNFYKHSKNFSQIQNICQEFLIQEKHIKSGKYPSGKLDDKLKEVLEEQKKTEQKINQEIDKTWEKRKIPFFSSKLDALLIDLKTPLIDFIGREKQLAFLKEALIPLDKWNIHQSTRLVALSGAGGIGKTELACYFASLHIKDFSFICWINCETAEMRLQAYKILAKKLNLSIEIDKKISEEVFKNVNHYLENHPFDKPWLLILDNVVSPLYLPERESILTTSIRKDLWPSPEKCLEVPIFDEQEAFQYLKKKIQQNDDINIKLLIKKLGCYPLALAQAAALITEAGISVSSYYKSFQKNQLYFLKHEGTSRHQNPLFTTWLLTLDHLKEHHPLAFNGLNICVHLGPGEIPQSWIKAWLDDEKKTVVNNHDLITYQFLRVLQNYSLVRSTPLTESFVLHDLMRDTICIMQQKKAFEFYKKAFALLEKEGEKIDKNSKVETMKELFIWIFHAAKMTQSNFFVQQSELSQIKILKILGKLRRDLGNYKESLDANIKILEITKKLYGSIDSLQIATSLNDVGVSLSIIGQEEEALKYHQEALKMQRKLFSSDDHPDIADSLDKIGSILLYKGWKKDALITFQQALDIRKRFFGADDHPDIANSLHKIGFALLYQGHDKEALEAFQKSLQLQRKIYNSKNHLDVAFSLYLIGNILIDLKQAEEAQKYFNEAFILSEKIYSTNYDTNALFLIENILSNQGKTKEALQYFKKILQNCRKINYSENQPIIIQTLDIIGSILLKLERREEALKYFQQAFELYKKNQGLINYIDIAFSLEKIGNILLELKRHEEALEYHQNALKIWKKVYDSGNHRKIAVSLGTIGSILLILERPQEALEYCQNALEIWEKVFSSHDNLNIAVSLEQIGDILSKLERQEEALEYYQNVLKIWKKVYELDDYPEISSALNKIGITLSALGHKEEALKYFKEGLEINRRIYASRHHSDIVISLNHIGNILLELERVEEALKYLKEAEDINKQLELKNTDSETTKISNISYN